MAIDKAIVAARLQEINEGLMRQSGGLVEAHFRKSKRLGAAARICNLIRGQDVISDYTALIAACGELGIVADTVEAALCELEEIGYVTLHRSGGDIKKIEERIPLLTSRYEAIGDKWQSSKPKAFSLFLYPPRAVILSGAKNLLVANLFKQKQMLRSAQHDSVRDSSLTVYRNQRNALAKLKAPLSTS